MASFARKLLTFPSNYAFYSNLLSVNHIRTGIPLQPLIDVVGQSCHSKHQSEQKRFYSRSTYRNGGMTSTFSTSPTAEYVEETKNGDVTEKINTQISSADSGRLFAVVHLAGHQRKITTEDILIVPKHIEADIGERIRLNKVMMVGARDFSLIGRPVLNANTVRVEATVLEKTLSYVRIHFHYKRRKNYRKLRPFQDQHTMLRINSIEITPLDS